MGSFDPLNFRGMMKRILFILLFMSGLFAQGNVRIVGKDANGTSVFANHDEFGNYININLVTKELHLGNVYTISKTFVDVASGSSAQFRIKAGSKKLHFEIIVTTENKAYLKTYANTTYTDTGTVYIPFNRLIGSTNTSTAIITYNPTVNSLGDMRGDDLIGSGTPTRAGGSSADIESVLLPGKEFLLDVSNEGATVGDINIIINYYEEQ